MRKYNRTERRKLAKDSGGFKRKIKPREIASVKVRH